MPDLIVQGRHNDTSCGDHLCDLLRANAIKYGRAALQIVLIVD